MSWSRFFFAAFLTPIAVLVETASAQAYLDPGTGSMLLQGLLGGVAGAAVVIRIYWSRLKSVFRRGSAKKDASEGAV